MSAVKIGRYETNLTLKKFSTFRQNIQLNFGVFQNPKTWRRQVKSYRSLSLGWHFFFSVEIPPSYCDSGFAAEWGWPRRFIIQEKLETKVAKIFQKAPNFQKMTENRNRLITLQSKRAGTSLFWFFSKIRTPRKVWNLRFSVLFPISFIV